MTATKRHISFLILLATGLLAACTEPEPPQPETQPEICLNTNVTGLQKRVNSIDNNTELQGYDLKIDAYFHDTETKYLDNRKLHYTGGDPDWVFWDGSAQLHYYWPIVGSVYDPASANITYTSLDFIGYCPYDKPSYIGAPTYDHSTGISFTCDLSSYMTLARQIGAEAPTIPVMQEYLVAILDEQTLATQTAAGGALPLQFQHPFALIKFTITAASGTNVQINSISIADLYTSGTCTYNGSTTSWGSYDDESKATMTLTQVLKNGGTTEGTPFMVIPNNYGSKYLTVNATWTDWSNTVTISDYGTDVSFNWEPGRLYTYNLTLDKYGLKVDAGKYTEQW